MLLVLNALLEDPDAHLYGFELLGRTGLKSGTMYPILGRLEREAWLRSDWEEVDPSTLGRPRRRYYRLTSLGYLCSVRAVEDLERKRHTRRDTRPPRSLTPKAA